MSIKVGLIGPHDSLQIVREYLHKINDFTCSTFTCIDEQDLEKYVLPQKSQMDLWLCTGPITYKIVQEWGKLEAPILHIQIHGTALYSLLLKIAYTHGVTADQISFDAITKEDVLIALQQVGMTEHAPRVKSDTFDFEPLIQFHRTCFEQGLSKVAITGHPIDAILRKEGIPAYRIFPTEISMESAVSEMRRVYETLQFKKSQIAVQIIEYDVVMHEQDTTALTTQHLHDVERQFMQQLMPYVKQVQGSILTIGFGRYAIFSTRGFLQDATENFSQKAEVSSLPVQQLEDLTCGIGIGRSAQEAEVNAWHALMQSRTNGKGSWMVCFDDRSMTGPLGEAQQLTYSYSSQQIEAIRQKTSLSAVTLQKLSSIIHKRGTEQFSANELAQYLQMTPRSARRILNELEMTGLAKVVAEESPRQTGRPRKIYQLQLND